jgi:hypothetical protein
MNNISLSQLVPILQLAIGPVILISGVGLLLLTLTNRFGRMVDRSRLLNQELEREALAPGEATQLQAQIDILHRRAEILRRSIILGAITVLLVGVLILVLFLSALLKLEAAPLIIAIFCMGQLALIGSMLAFIRDMNLSLKAVRLELKR